MSAKALVVGDMIAIPGGTFLMGQTDGRDDERPVHRVTVSPFCICRYPITNHHWEVFRRETGREELLYMHPSAPAVSVTWFDAVAFCNWLSSQWFMAVRLPTEAEWELAARGGIEQQLYPWGALPLEYPPQRWQMGPEAVAQDDPNGYGLYDMGQNVREWCSDWYDARYYAVSPEKDPKGPDDGVQRVARGGGWQQQDKCSRCASRGGIPPDFRCPDYGFRIVADMGTGGAILPGADETLEAAGFPGVDGFRKAGLCRMCVQQRGTCYLPVDASSWRAVFAGDGASTERGKNIPCFSDCHVPTARDEAKTPRTVSATVITVTAPMPSPRQLRILERVMSDGCTAPLLAPRAARGGPAAPLESGQTTTNHYFTS